jgi:hypothetical protein
VASKGLTDRVSVANSIVANEYSATADGASVDLQGYESAEIILSVGVIGGTSTPTFPINIQDSPDDTTWTTLLAAELDGGLISDIVAANDNGIHTRGYLGTERYIRVQIGAVTGTSPLLDVAAVVVRGHARHQPVA